MTRAQTAHLTAVLLFLALVVVAISLYNLTLSPTNPSPSSVDAAIHRGLGFLADSYTSDKGFDDPYLQLVYAGEHLPCPLPDCNLTYRRLDGYVNLHYLGQDLSDAGPLTSAVGDANTVISSLPPAWSQQGLYNIVEHADPNGIALDTYCILGLTTNDSAMAEVVAESLSADLDWLALQKAEGDPPFRQIADESWCIRLLAAAGENITLIDSLTNKSIRQTDSFLSQTTSLQRKTYVLIHALLLLDELEQQNLTTPHHIEKNQAYHAALGRIVSDGGLDREPLLAANVLEALARTGYENEAILEHLAAVLLESQHDDGHWEPGYQTSVQGSESVFTTFRAVLALNQYRKAKGWHD